MAFDPLVLAKSDKRSPSLQRVLAQLLKYEQSHNIAQDMLDEDDGQAKLETLGQEVERKYKLDKKSRSDWEESAERAMDIALQVRKVKNYPFEKASNIKYPLVTVAALQFGARAYPAIVDGNHVVKAQVLGRDDGQPVMGQDGKPVVDPQSGQPQWQAPPGSKRAKADRVSAHMSYQLLNEMEEWEEDTDVLLHHLPIVGCAFRKVWRSEELGRSKSEMVPAINLVVNNKVRSLNEAPAITHEIYLYPQDIEERVRNETFLDIDLPAPEGTDANDEDAPHMFLEQHRYLDLDGDGYREPYIVTIHKETCKVVRVVANYRVEDIKDDGKKIKRIPRENYFVKYSFIPDPKGGFYDIGFGKLLESIGEAIDTCFNQMLDAGHLQTAGGGFISSGVRLKKDKIKVAPGVYEQIGTNGKIQDLVYNHQFPGPSAVLFNLLGMLVEAARDITAVKDILTGDTGDKGVQTATTTLALIEQGLKVFTAIYKRVYRAMRDEFKLLFELNARYLSDQEYFTFNDQQQVVAKDDYDVKSVDIVPVADPKMVTDMQRTGRANVLLQIAASPLGPGLNPQECLKRILDSLGMEEPEKLIQQQQGPSPGEQAQLAELQAKANKLNAGAERDKAEAQKTQMEANLAPQQAEHASLMDENRIKLEADAQAFDQHSQRVGHIQDAHSLVTDVQLRAADLQQRAEADKRKFEADKVKAKAAVE